jgi:tetratricopeptide (TPR) repeat protein
VQQDYILRMIQQLSGFVTGMLLLRRSGRSAEAIQQIEDAYGRFSGLSATLVHAISEDDLIQLLRARGGVDPDRAWALAELLREEALAYDELGNQAEAEPRYLKSLRLYLEVLDVIEEMPGVLNVDGLEAVVERVSDLDLTPSTRRRLVEYFTDTGRFDRAENLVLWSVDDPNPARETVEDAAVFYERLHRMADDELERGGLSRDEVEQGLERMLALLDDSEPAAIGP